MKNTNDVTRPHRARRGAPGMAMLLVLMLIVMVSAAGVFATKSAALEVRSSGFVRQAGQTHYVAETGLITAMDELRRDCGRYWPLINNPPAGTPIPSGLIEPERQHRFYLDYLDRLMLPRQVFEPSRSGSGGRRIEGSLGTGILEPGFVTTATLLYAAPSNVPRVASGAPLAVFQLSADAITRLPRSPSPQAVPDPRNFAVGTESVRVIAQIPGCY